MVFRVAIVNVIRFGENAIKDLSEKVASMRAGETIVETTPVGDSRANGRAEIAVQSVEKQVRVLKMGVDEGSGWMSIVHPACSWLPLHAADVLT